MAYTTVLRNQLHSPNAATRVKAISIIARERHVEFAGELIEVLTHDPSPEIRGRSAWALGRLHYKNAHGRLVECLKGGDTEVKTWSAWALGELGFHKDIPTLARSAEKEKESPVRRAMYGAIRKLRLESTRSHVSQVERLLEPPRTRDPLARRIVEELMSLEWPGDKDAIVALRRQLRQVDPPYFSMYMQWFQRRPTIALAIDNQRLVYGR